MAFTRKRGVKRPIWSDYFMSKTVLPPSHSQPYLIFTTRLRTVVILEMKILRNKTPEFIVLVYKWEEKLSFCLF